jgi:signal transduction histidine kinase
MRIRPYAIVLAAALALGICGVAFLLPVPQYKVDLVEINNITATLAQDFEQVASEDYQLPASSYDYAVIDAEENLLRATRQGLSETIFQALRQGDVIVDITRDGEVLGKVIWASRLDVQWQTYQRDLKILAIALLVLMAAVAAVFLLRAHLQLLRPFQHMKDFAGRVAAGELDAPLIMDKRNAFGAFTESFDLMREELKRSRENEQAAEESKRELVAALSHDIQTPLSSIKAVAELMEVTADGPQAEKLKTIQSKASQIQTLVNELFHTTLEELDQLSVEPIGVPSSEIAQMIRAADYRSLVDLGAFPGCLVRADPARLLQALDNLIANSYKYADTVVQATAEFEDEGLAITLSDQGPGVKDEELPRLFIKYFRGTSAEGKNGYGLGLFIAQHLIARMDGRLECRNTHPGFATKIWLKLDQ